MHARSVTVNALTSTASLPPRELTLGFQPVIERRTVGPAACLVQLVGESRNFRCGDCRGGRCVGAAPRPLNANGWRGLGFFCYAWHPSPLTSCSWSLARADTNVLGQSVSDVFVGSPAPRDRALPRRPRRIPRELRPGVRLDAWRCVSAYYSSCNRRAVAGLRAQGSRLRAQGSRLNGHGSRLTDRWSLRRGLCYRQGFVNAGCWDIEH